MVAQAAQAADALVITAAQGVGQQVAEQPADEAQHQGFAQGQHAAAGQHRDGEDHHRPRHDQPDYRQALHAGDDHERQPQPLGVGGQPLGKGFEPLAHAGFLEARPPFDPARGRGVSSAKHTRRDCHAYAAVAADECRAPPHAFRRAPLCAGAQRGYNQPLSLQSGQLDP